MEDAHETSRSLGEPAPARHDRRGILGEAEFADLSRELRADLRRRGLREHSIDDVVQETWLRTLRRRKRDPHRLGAWLSKVARRLVWEGMRADQNRRHREQANARFETWSDHQEETSESEVLRRVRELPEHLRRPIELRYLEGYSPSEIATRLGRRPATVRSQLMRGLEVLRTRLASAPGRRRRALSFLGVLGNRVEWGRSWWRTRGAMLSALAASAVALTLVYAQGPQARHDPRFLATTARAAIGLREELLVPGALPPAASRDSIPNSDPESPAGTAPRLAGVVRDPDGAPVSGALIHLGATLGPGEAVSVAVTDAQGRYELFGLEPASEELLWATHDDWYESRRCYVATLSPEGPCDLYLTRGRLASLRVEDVQGRPLGDAEIEIRSTIDEAPLLRANGGLEYPPGPVRARTNPSGEVRLRIPADRELTCWLSSPGEGLQLLECVPGQSLAEGGREPGAPLTLRHRRASGIQGRVVWTEGVPSTDTWIQVTRGAQVGGATRVDADGSFRLGELGAGPFELRVWSDDPGYTASFFESGELLPGEWLQLECVLSPRHTVQGRVSPWPSSFAGAQVVATSRMQLKADRIPRTVPVESDGSFRVTGCAPVECLLDIRLPDGTTHPLEPTDDRAVLPGQGERLFGLAAGVPGMLTVRFVSEDPQHLPTLVELRNNRTIQSMIASPDAVSGQACFENPSGYRWWVLAWIPGLGTWQTARSVGTGRGDTTEVFRVPSPGRLVLDVTPLAGADAARMTALAEAPAINARGFGGAGSSRSWKELEHTGPWRFEGELVPGSYSIRVQCPDAFALEGVAVVREGLETRMTVTPHRSLPISLSVLASRPIQAGERVWCEARDGTGNLLLTHALPGRVSRRVLLIPVSTRRLAVHSSRGLEGALSFGPDDLQPAGQLFDLFLAPPREPRPAEDPNRAPPE